MNGICTRFNKIITCDVRSGNHQSSLCPPASHRSQHGQWRKWFGEDLPWLQRKVSNMNRISVVIWHNLLFIVVFFCINRNKYTFNWKEAPNFRSFSIQKADPQISSRNVGDSYSKNKLIKTKHVGRKELRECEGSCSAFNLKWSVKLLQIVLANHGNIPANLPLLKLTPVHFLLALFFFRS